MKWTRKKKPKIEPLACPWLIKRFIDPAAEFIYVSYEQVINRAAAQNAIPFDIPGVEHTTTWAQHLKKENKPGNHPKTCC